MQKSRSPRWIPRSDVLKRYQTSDSSLARWVKANLFPAPKRFGACSDRWDMIELDEYDADPDAWKAGHEVRGAA